MPLRLGKLKSCRHKLDHDFLVSLTSMGRANQERILAEQTEPVFPAQAGRANS
jgi:hypothetical protein